VKEVVMRTWNRGLGRGSRGFTLIELMVVITILGLLASITSVAVLQHLKTARIEQTKLSMRGVREGIQTYYIKKNRIPQSLNELCGPEEDDDRILPMETPPKDGWKNDFVYNPRDKKHYDLISLGSDGVEGGDGDAKDITLADLNKSEDEDER
jgi:general secretion pathway protein G